MRNNWLVFLTAFFLFSIPIVEAETNSSDEHIRNIVKELLLEKDNKIEVLEARIQQLEQKLQLQQEGQTKLEESLAQDTHAQKNNEAKTWTDKFSELGEQVEELKASAESNGLEISGFFDVSARTENSSESTFDLGAFEIDLEYAYNEHFAASSALVWDCDDAEIGVAVI